MYRRTAITLFLLGIFVTFSIPELAAAKPKKGASWICAAQYQHRYKAQVASVNIQTYREKFLVNGRQPVRRAMFVFPTFYKIMRQHIRSVVGKRYGIKTIAERVESLEVLDKLGSIGIEYAQGFYIARPASVSTFSPWAEDGIATLTA